MTISAYTGLPGHGKSYGVVENVIAPALKAKRDIYTNIPMNRDVCLKRFGMAPVQFEMQDIIENPDWWTDIFRPGALLVIDELWRLWPSGLKANNVREQDKGFLAEHRHMVGKNGSSVEIVFVTQDLSQVASFARALVETTFRVTKLSAIGLDKRYRVDVYFGPVTGVTPPISKRQREIQGKFRRETYELYKSHTKSVTGEAGNESRVDGRYHSLGKLSIKLGFVLVLIAGIGFYFGLKQMIGYYGHTSEVDVVKDVQQRPVDNSIRTERVQVQEKFKFLSKSEGIWITGKLSLHNPNGRINVEYIFEVMFDDSIVRLNQLELAKLGYEVNHLNDCMVILKGVDFSGYALCRQQRHKQGWIENLVTNPGADPT